MSPPPSVAVIGAGIAGLSCAQSLAQAGTAVTVFDKGRGVAGRTSTRRAGEDSAQGWDHGAVSFLAEHPAFQEELARWIADGVIAPWPVAPAGPADEPLDPQALLTPGFSSSWVGVPSMSAVARSLARELDVRCGHRIETIRHKASAWWLEIESANGLIEEGPYDELVLTAPPAQSRALLESVAPSLVERLVAVWTQPSWVLLAISERVENPVSIRRVGPGHLPDGVATLVCEDSKPGRRAHDRGTRWVLQTTAGWAQEHLEASAEEVLPQLTALLEQAIDAPTLETQAHRWRYARVHRPLGLDCLREESARLTLAGDFCRGDGVENAWLSGRAAAQAILEA